jgi:ATP-dependent Lon protease
VLIARDHLLPRQLAHAGLDSTEVTVTEDALRHLAAEYSREAGVRDLERLIARVLRKITAKAALAGEVTELVTVEVPISPSTWADRGTRRSRLSARRCPESRRVWP